MLQKKPAYLSGTITMRKPFGSGGKITIQTLENFPNHNKVNMQDYLFSVMKVSDKKLLSGLGVMYLSEETPT